MRASTRQWSCTHTQTHARISPLSLTRARTHTHTHTRTGTCNDYCLPRQQWSCESASLLRFTYIACLVSFVCVRSGYLDRRLLPILLWNALFLIHSEPCFCVFCSLTRRLHRTPKRIFLILLRKAFSLSHSETHFLSPTPKSMLVHNTQLYERFVLYCVWCWHILFHSYRFLTYKGGFLCC